MKSIIAVFAILALFGLGNAADICVGPTATGYGNGADWNNMISWINVTFVRGNTYYLRSGTYTDSKNLNAPTSGDIYVYIKKATEASHGSNIGWVSSYGEGAVIFSSAGLVISSSYWDIDGIVGGGPGSWTSGHGIQFTSSVGGGAQNFVSVISNVTQINMRRLSFVQTGDPTITTIGAHGIYAPVSLSYSIFERLYFHNLVGLPFFFRYGRGNIIQYNYTGDICGMSVRDQNQHCEALVQHGMSDVHFRWNYIAECPSSGGFIKNNTDLSSDIRIYGNVFETGGPAIACNTGGCPNWRVFNNTFHHISGGPLGGDGTWTGLLYYNNLIYGAESAGAPNGEHNYNWFSAIKSIQCNMNPSYQENITKRYPNQCDLVTEIMDPFVNSAGRNPEDFRLRAIAKTKDIGIDVCQLDACTGENRYNVDAFGTSRPNGAGWDIGAFEFSEQGGLRPPTNLRAITP